MYTEFNLAVPDTLDAALAALDSGEGTVLPIAGGTNLMIDMRSRHVKPDTLVNLNNIANFRDIKESKDGIEIGGGTTISDILYSDIMPTHAPSLFQSAQVFAGQMVRNTGTVAGNICSASPAADTVPPLLTLDAVLTLSSASGNREVALSEFYTGFKQDVRKPNEIISKISWGKLADNTANGFYKLGLRKGDAITITGVAVLLTINNKICEKARIAFNSVAPVVKRAEKAEQLLEGKEISAESIEAAAKQALEESSPIDDIRATAEFRRHCVHVLTRRLLTQAWQQITN